MNYLFCKRVKYVHIPFLKVNYVNLLTNRIIYIVKFMALSEENYLEYYLLYHYTYNVRNSVLTGEIVLMQTYF